MWDADTPFRTGVPTLLRLAQIMCSILATFTPVIKAHLDSAKHIYVDALNAACSDFVSNIEHPRDNQ